MKYSMKIIRILPLTSILIFGFLLLPTLVLAVENTYYVTQNGNGTRSGESLGNAWSVTNFNNSTNWSTTDHPNKIDAGDTVYFSGTITSALYLQGSGSFGNYVTLDGFDSGDCDPINSECIGSAEISRKRSPSIYLDTQDYIIIQDFRITGGEIQLVGKNHNNTSEYITIRRNEIHDIDGKAVTSNVTHYLTVGGGPGQGNKIYDVGSNTGHPAISPNSGRDIVISYNHIYATKSNGGPGDRGIDGIATHRVSRMLIEYNTIHSMNDRYGSDAMGEDGIDLKRESTDIIIRFNDIYDMQGAAGIIVQGGTNNVYIYGNRLYDTIWGGVFVYGRKSGYGPINNVHIWSNLIYGNAKNAVVVRSDLDPVDDIYIYNNTIAYNGFAYTELDGDSRKPNSYDSGIKLTAGTSHVKNNIFFKNQPDISTHIHLSPNSESRIGSLEHNTYDWPGQPSNLKIGSKVYTVESLKILLGREDDWIDGGDEDPGFNDPDGPDNTYGTEDDNYTLNGTNIDNGKDLSKCFDVLIQGRNYHMCYNDALDPNATNWATIPPTVRTTKQENHGSWERGAYVYMTGKSYSNILPPSGLIVIEE